MSGHFENQTSNIKDEFAYTGPLLNQLHHSQPVNRRRRSWLASAIRELIHIGLIVVMLYLVVNMLVPRFLVEGTSMEPTIHTDERVVVSRLDYMVSTPRRGDIIVFRHDDTYLIKRIIGLPGESVRMIEGHVYINGNELEEAYIAGLCGSVACSDELWLLKKDEYFVLGDNRDASLDSHNFGPIDQKQIVGRVRMRYWPISQFNLFAEYTY